MAFPITIVPILFVSGRLIPRRWLPQTLLLTIVLSGPVAQAMEYPLPGNGDTLIGELQFVEVQARDTLLDIARQYNLGFNEITAANPDVDPWLPREGTQITLPTRYILPDPPWTGIVVNLSEMRLYYFPQAEQGKAARVITHPIGIGRQKWSTPLGEYQVIMKLEKPSWTMPDSVYQQALANGYQPRRLVPAGPDNPLGEFAMMLDADGLLIHGTNKPFSIGMRVSYGCLRLYPEDIRHLISLVPRGTRVRIEENPYKFGRENGVLYIEAHAPLQEVSKMKVGVNLTPVVSGLIKAQADRLSAHQWESLVTLAARHDGMPIPVIFPRHSGLSSPMR